MYLLLIVITYIKGTRFVTMYIYLTKGYKGGFKIVLKTIVRSS